MSKRLQDQGAGNEQFTALHGTNTPAAAKNIARNGPNLEKIANGRAHGNGFYTSTRWATASGYAGGSGSICICSVTPGRTQNGGSVATLQDYDPPLHSVVVGQGGSERWYILPHPDQVLVKYIIDLGKDESVTIEQAKLQQLCLYQLVLGYRLREAEAKGEANEAIGS